jgi:hypothetical protein
MKKLMGMFLLVASLVLVPSVHAWSLHYLITEKVLQSWSHPPAVLSSEVEVKSIDEFLSQNGGKVEQVFESYYDWLKQNGQTRFIRQKFDSTQPTVAQFLRAARLSPKTQFKQIERLLPRDPALPEITGAFKTENSEFQYRFKNAVGKVSAKSVLSTFSDEPDWGMDQGLFQIPEYGYGKIPYGAETGIASQAPFHMLFLNENYIVKLAAPEMKDGMGRERIELFSRLSKLAFQVGHPYWGFRFSAWVLHYLEDLGQPFHSRAVPHWGIGDYLKFAVSGNKTQVKAEMSQILKNRHFAYEDFVAYALQSYFIRPDTFNSKIAGALAESGSGLDRNPVALALSIGKSASDHAAAIDRAVVVAYGERMMTDPRYDLESDTSYHVRDVITKLDPKKAEVILRETQSDFANVGNTVRSYLLSL